MQLGYQIFSSPLGEILVAATPFAVTHVMHGDNKALLASQFLMDHGDLGTASDASYAQEACIAIADYLNGNTHSINVEIAPEGTDFQREVWQALRRIPYGKTLSYSDVARGLGMPDAFRAVAHTCAENPVPLIIPCHRVIHKNGDVSGYAWGLDAKRFLLDMEKKHARATQVA